MVNRFGFMPNGNRVYYLNRSQPPLLILMVFNYFQATKDFNFIMNNIEVSLSHSYSRLDDNFFLYSSNFRIAKWQKKNADKIKTKIKLENLCFERKKSYQLVEPVYSVYLCKVEVRKSDVKVNKIIANSSCKLYGFGYVYVLWVRAVDVSFVSLCLFFLDINVPKRVFVDLILRRDETLEPDLSCKISAS